KFPKSRAGVVRPGGRSADRRTGRAGRTGPPSFQEFTVCKSGQGLVPESMRTSAVPERSAHRPGQHQGSSPNLFSGPPPFTLLLPHSWETSVFEQSLCREWLSSSDQLITLRKIKLHYN